MHDQGPTGIHSPPYRNRDQTTQKMCPVGYVGSPPSLSLDVLLALTRCLTRPMISCVVVLGALVHAIRGCFFPIKNGHRRQQRPSARLVFRYCASLPVAAPRKTQTRTPIKAMPYTTPGPGGHVDSDTPCFSPLRTSTITSRKVRIKAGLPVCRFTSVLVHSRSPRRITVWPRTVLASSTFFENIRGALTGQCLDRLTCLSLTSSRRVQ
jgi:hypothetical protein